MTNRKNQTKLGTALTVRALLCIFIVFINVFIITSIFAGNSMKTRAIASLMSAADDRADIVVNYIRSVENTLTDYIKAGQITDLLANPTNNTLQEKAQMYTENFSKDVEYLEGIYISDWNTKTLAHTNPKSVGITTRPTEEGRDFLHNAMENSKNGIYNSGIIISPASGEQCVSMYKGVFDSTGNLIGHGGIAVYTSGIVDKLNGLSLSGLNTSQYALINLKTGEYILHPDAEKALTVADEDYVIDILEKLKKHDSQTENYTQNGGYITAYHYIPEYDWVFLYKAEETDVLKDASTLRKQMGIINVCGIMFLTFWIYMLMRRLMKPLNTVTNAVVNLGQMHFDVVDDVNSLTNGYKEISDIATAIIDMSNSLKCATNDVSNILGELAQGNLTVDTDANKDCYTGDFAPIAISLETIKNNLVETMTKIQQASDNVNSGASHVAAGASNLSEGTIAQAADIDALVTRVEGIKNQIQDNADSCVNAIELTNRTTNSVSEVNSQMQELSDAMENIASSSDKISGIIKTIEDIAFQTNILALNAAIEAARAGEAGKGFSVVADEVRNLAAKSAEAVGDTTRLIESSLSAVDSGKSITDSTAEKMELLKQHTESVQSIISSITASCTEQRDMIEAINKQIGDISNVVQANSATAEESAAASEELTQQSETLKNLVGKFKL